MCPTRSTWLERSRDASQVGPVQNSQFPHRSTAQASKPPGSPEAVSQTLSSGCEEFKYGAVCPARALSKMGDEKGL